jgi:hypothetical protein
MECVYTRSTTGRARDSNDKPTSNNSTSRVEGEEKAEEEEE